MKHLSQQIYTLVAQNNPLGDAGDLNIPDVKADATTIETVVNILFYLAGALSIIFIIIGGLMYIFSAGNPDTAKKARTTIIYALVGLAVTVLAYLIVTVVLGLVGGEDIQNL